ncbi:hypothetical protein B9Z55_025316 [Caenorhabditis nigoni]|uniref:Uncharacterized protein n=1 Tax=Caenorhabditis nigoni TaxID=1611254 RepID=A0A2G5SYF4_9PELO|nr:hypothetical protein B9Z55_025316 [Caenorhabditis nigoni]
MTSNTPQAVPLNPTQRVNYRHTSFNPMQNHSQSNGQIFSQHQPTLPGPVETFTEYSNPNCPLLTSPITNNPQGFYGYPAQPRYSSSDPNYYHQTDSNSLPLNHELAAPAQQYEQTYHNGNPNSINRVSMMSPPQPLVHYPYSPNQPMIQYTPTMATPVPHVQPAPPMGYHIPENMVQQAEFRTPFAQSEKNSHPFPNSYQSSNIPAYPSTEYWQSNQNGCPSPASRQINHWQRTTYFSHPPQNIPYQPPMPMHQPETRGPPEMYGYFQNENTHGTMISNQGYYPISNPNYNWQHTVYYDKPANNSQYTVASIPQRTNNVVESSPIMDPESAGISGPSQEGASGGGSSPTESTVQTEETENHATVPEVDEKGNCHVTQSTQTVDTTTSIETPKTTIHHNEELETDQPSQNKNLTLSETTTTLSGTFKVSEKKEITGDESNESTSIKNFESDLQTESQCETSPIQTREQLPFSATLKFANEAEELDQKSSVLDDQQQSTDGIASIETAENQSTSQISSHVDERQGAGNTDLKHAVSYLSEEVKRLNVYCENIICSDKLNEDLVKAHSSQPASDDKLVDQSIDIVENQITSQSTLTGLKLEVAQPSITTNPSTEYEKDFPTLGDSGPRIKESRKTYYDSSSNSKRSSKTYADVLGFTGLPEPKLESSNSSSIGAAPSINIGNQNQSPHTSNSFRSNSFQRGSTTQFESSRNNGYRSNYNGRRNQNSSQAYNRNQFRRSYHKPANEKTEEQLETILAKTELILSSVKDLQGSSNKPIHIPSVNISLNNNYTDGFCKIEKSVENSERNTVELDTPSDVEDVKDDDSNKIKSECDASASDTDTVATEHSNKPVKKNTTQKSRKSKSKKKGCKAQKSLKIKSGTNTTASSELDVTDSDDIAKVRHEERTFDHLISYALDDYCQAFRPIRNTYLAFHKELPSLHPLQIEIMEFWKTRTPGTLPFMETLKTLKRELTARINAYNSGDMETWKMKRFLETVKEELLSDYGETVVLQDLSFLFHKYLSDYNRNVLYKRYMEMVITFPMWKPEVDPEFAVTLEDLEQYPVKLEKEYQINFVDHINLQNNLRNGEDIKKVKEKSKTDQEFINFYQFLLQIKSSILEFDAFWFHACTFPMVIEGFGFHLTNDQKFFRLVFKWEENKS